MQSEKIDTSLQGHLEPLKQALSRLAKENRSLELALESAAKHMPIYLKIVKGHIEQLAKVLQLETHQHRSLESAGLAEPVIQLIQLFRELHEEDIQLIEILAEEAKNWPLNQNEDTHVLENTAPIATEA